MYLNKKRHSGVTRLVLLLAVFAAALALLLLAAGRIGGGTDERQTALLKDAIDNAVVGCYATEGRYPESLDYLVENYGIQIDKERYVVIYDAFADNVRPRVQVIRIGED